MNFLKISILTLMMMSSSCETKVTHPDLGDGLFAIIQTVKGDLILKLEYEKTPMTVANFVTLAEGTNTFVDEKHKGKPFFDGLIFHRVIKDFMIQGGDPLGTGSGNPGYKFKDEFHESLVHDKPGILSMANSGKATNGSQFFITHKATPHLNNRHTVFGHVVKGLDIVNTIEKNDVINKVEIIRQGKSAKSFDAVTVFSSVFKEMEEDAKIATAKKKEAIQSLLDNETKAKELPSGLKIFITKQGEGVKPKKGQKVKIHYTGFLRDGSVFDSSVKKNRPFETNIGVGRVIQGWDEGILELNIGTKAILYIPSHMAYGSRGAGRVIPPNSDLIFEIELLEILK